MLRSSAPLQLPDLIAIWRARDPQRWSSSPDIYQLLVEGTLEHGEPLLAYDMVREGLEHYPSDVRLRQLQGLALARSGATERARRILEELRAQNYVDEETLGMLARTHKDLSAVSAHERQAHLRRAASIYSEAYKLSRGYWSGINAATTALLTGQRKRAAALAKEVSLRCLRQLRKSRDNYWLLATLGEAALVLRDWPKANKWYAQARAAAGHRYGDLQSSRRNARLILDYWKADDSEVEAILHVPAVAIFTGHMIDQPGRAKPRFPAELEPAVLRAIAKQITAAAAGIGYSSAACGSDILFLEAMLEAGGEVIVVLPYEIEQFIRDSVEVIPASNWRARFDRVIERATRVVAASSHRFGIGGLSYVYSDELLLGLARIHARQLGTGLAAIAVWDGCPGDGPGGTATVVSRWRDNGLPIQIINPAAPLDDAPATRQIAHTTKSRPAKGRLARLDLGCEQFRSRIITMLFADVVDFSRLTEDAMPRFVKHYLGAIRKLTRRSRRHIVAKNTWGDGLFLVFPDVEAGGKFALKLCDLITRTRWETYDLPKGLGLRIALHAGPAYSFSDPITGRCSYIGTHVNLAARMEPITPPGQVYASEAFAALAAARRASFFTFDYVGKTPMPKGLGTSRLFHVRPSAR